MGMSFGQHMDMRPSPSLIQFTEILQLSGLEMQAAIRQAVDQNPALELAEVDTCPACGDPLLPDGTCLRCARGEDLAGAATRELAEAEEDDPDPLSRVADQMGLAEQVLAELASLLEAEDLPLAEYLLGELDDRGFLDSSLEELALVLDVPLERLERVLAAVQSVGPIGLAARDVRECLLLQLDRWQELGVDHPLARPIVEDHLDDLGRGRYAQLARALGVGQEEVLEGRDFIRSHLRPYPMSDQVDRAAWQRPGGGGTITPDIVVRLTTEGELEVEVVESRRFCLTISPLYHRYARQIETGAPMSGLSAPERRHVANQVQEARQFIHHIHERRATMHRVAAYVMARQRDYLRFGPRHLKPLTRSEVSEELGLHESTVSRATAGKHVLLPSRQVVPFATFFKVALSVHDVLRELIANEKRPLTDDELAGALGTRGYCVARRTVAKYRNEMGILPSSMR